MRVFNEFSFFRAESTNEHARTKKEFNQPCLVRHWPTQTIYRRYQRFLAVWLSLSQIICCRFRYISKQKGLEHPPCPSLPTKR